MKLRLLQCCVQYVLCAGFIACVSVTCAWAENLENLRDKYEEIVTNPGEFFAVPMAVSSWQQDDLVGADVYGIIDHPFGELATLLTMPAAWCEFIPLTLNIKACTHHQVDGRAEVTFYAGRKFYEPPEDAYQLSYRYRIIERKDDYLRIELSADRGPFKTKDYRIIVEQLAVDKDKSFVRLHSAYRASLWSRLGTRTYLATLGAKKVGFSIESYDEAGRPRYIKGVQGVIERNAMRYYLALQAHLDTRSEAEDQRHAARSKRWFDLTEEYYTQLHELDWSEYRAAKNRERLNQQRLQNQLDDAR